jgi:superfamily I DNA and/or RNA helicase
MEKISDRIESIVNTFDTRQRRAFEAILDNSVTDDGFVFPIIDGPPGTGKTTVGVAAAVQYLQDNPKGQVFYTCYTHFAAEQAKKTFEQKFLFPKEQVIKLQPSSFRSWERGIIGCKADLSDLSRNEMRTLKDAPVLLCTLYGSTRAKEARRSNCKVIIDEFSQVDPPMFFMTMNRIKTINPSSYAMLGDPLQLPVVTTQSILRPNIGQFIRARKPHTPHQLILQHRMHSHICAGINSMRKKAFFTIEMQTADEVKNRDMEVLGYRWDKSKVNPKYREILDPTHPFVILNTDSLEGDEEQTESGSTKNVGEARLAAELAENANLGYSKENNDTMIQTILSPYTAQVYEISTHLKEELKKCSTTIHRSQGQEFPLVIVSFVRKNPQGFIGFLEDLKLRAQVYVACSRAQAKLIVLLSTRTFIGRGHLIFESLYNTKEAYKEDAPK